MVVLFGTNAAGPTRSVSEGRRRASRTLRVRDDATPRCLRPRERAVKIRSKGAPTPVTRMPSLILIKSPGGVATNQSFPLNGGELFVIGRDAAECQIVIPNS